MLLTHKARLYVTAGYFNGLHLTLCAHHKHFDQRVGGHTSVRQSMGPPYLREMEQKHSVTADSPLWVVGGKSNHWVFLI